MLNVNKVYIHTESGKSVEILHLGEMKVESTWIPSVTYTHEGRIYTRTIQQFEEKFHER